MTGGLPHTLAEALEALRPAPGPQCRGKQEGARLRGASRSPSQTSPRRDRLGEVRGGSFFAAGPARISSSVVVWLGDGQGSPKPSSRSVGSGEGAGVSGGARELRPRQSRMARITSGWSMAAKIRIRPPQRSHRKASMANTRRSSSADEQGRCCLIAFSAYEGERGREPGSPSPACPPLRAARIQRTHSGSEAHQKRHVRGAPLQLPGIGWEVGGGGGNRTRVRMASIQRVYVCSSANSRRGLSQRREQPHPAPRDSRPRLRRNGAPGASLLMTPAIR